MIPVPVIPIPFTIPLGLIPIPGFCKIRDSKSNSDSISKWFRFWFQHHVIPIPILIPATHTLIRESFKTLYYVL